MPWGLKCFYGSGDLRSITCSCYRRQAFLRRDLFLCVLEQVRQRYAFVVLAYVVMPEHFHLLISEPEKGNPSVVMQALKLGFARRVLPARRCYDDHATEPKHVWQRRFYDYNVRSQHKRVEKLRYIHRNPVRRGLVASLEQWRWSSFRDYAHGESGPVRVDDWTVLKMKVRRA